VEGVGEAVVAVGEAVVAVGEAVAAVGEAASVGAAAEAGYRVAAVDLAAAGAFLVAQR
jgi:hypothetical protein